MTFNKKTNKQTKFCSTQHILCMLMHAVVNGIRVWLWPVGIQRWIVRYLCFPASSSFWGVAFFNNSAMEVEPFFQGSLERRIVYSKVVIILVKSGITSWSNALREQHMTVMSLTWVTLYFALHRCCILTKRDVSTNTSPRWDELKAAVLRFPCVRPSETCGPFLALIGVIKGQHLVE